ncbi:uncharacterized protein B0H18DRAFT_1154576 [Fomitopsis serialis]|uniref:uncharacterized protein n=1 Tax=Fomitopsis serialis TaxID=139415 RepID=UPI002008247D|nr:uncharacterized protein B0H18DRAFT_1154576 [Neoantrodia serialis]KAH9929201.1 hypothetical protein B0H18DRAFT_1154576 [Neoantrodia serialis]
MSPLPPSSPLTPIALSIQGSPCSSGIEADSQGLPFETGEGHCADDHPIESANRTPEAAIAVVPTPIPLSPSFPAANSPPQTPVARQPTPPLYPSSNGLDKSTPIRGSPSTKKKIVRAKGQKKRAKTLRRQREEQHERAQQLATANANYQAAIAAHAMELTLGDSSDEDASGGLAQARDGPAPSPRPREDVLEEVLALLKSHGLTWGDLVLYVSDPSSKKGLEKYKGMFDVPGRIEQVLTYWTSSRNSPTGRQALYTWIVNYVRRLVTREGIRATKDGVLQSSRMRMSEAFVTNFSLTQLHERLTMLCPLMAELLREFTMTTRQTKAVTVDSAARNNLRVGSALMTLLSERSQKNSYGRHIVGLYLYASGAQRQNISVLSQIGICSSYTTIAGTSAAKTPQHSVDSVDSSGSSSDSDTDSASDQGDESDLPESPQSPSRASQDVLELPEVQAPGPIEQSQVSHAEKDTLPRAQNNLLDDIDEDEPDEGGGKVSIRGAGLLRRLSEVCRSSARTQARLHELAHVYDNINWILRAAEQIMGRKDSIENGTCATVFPLFEAPCEDMRTTDLLHAFDTAPPLIRDDILLDASETQLLFTMLEHNILRIITSYGGEGFNRFRVNVERTLPRTAECIALHKTEVYPLPAMNIEEASVKGNAEVLEAIFSELGHDLSSTKFTETVKIVFGDQLSVARVRAVTNNRMGHDTFVKSFLYTTFAPGLFHYQMAAAHGLLEMHWGDPSLGPLDPASLYWHNTTLDRKPFVLSNRPPYRVGRDLIFHSLYGRILHCLELVSSCDSLDNYAESVTFEDLQQHVKEIVAQFVNPAVVSKLRSARSRESARASSDEPLAFTQGDMVFENACLFLRDALILREFCDSIKAGDSGRLIIILKILTLSYRGSGRTKYAQETLYLVHNLVHLWPKPLRDIIIKNWLVNTTGKPNHWYPVDLLQEHNIFWTKTIYNAQGSGASWDWLEMISPCINILRQLVTSMNEALGSKQGMKHAAPDLTRDLEELRRSLAEGNVYVVQPGRIIDGEKGVVPNVVAVGLSQLAGPLNDYNKLMAKLKKRRRRSSPLVAGAPGQATAATSESHDRSRDRVPTAERLASDLPNAHLEYEASGVQEVSDDEYDEGGEEMTASETLESWLEPEELFSLDEEDDVDPYLE